jgi:DNA-binding transcriptional LysR family regulator
MQDLNDLFFFAQVVENGGFAVAGRAIGVPKSKLSRRIALLEERLGVRLIQRSTRRFAVTEVGQVYYRHCLAMVAEAEAAQEAIERTQAEPQGTIRISCPVLLAQNSLAPIVSRFLAEHPRVRIHLEATNRRVDVIEEGFDLALRVRQPPLENSDLIIRVFSHHKTALVASPRFLDRYGRPPGPSDLDSFDSLDMTRPSGEHVWLLTGPDGTVHKAPHRPRLVTDDLATLRQAALDGIGIVQLPTLLIGADIAQGSLEPILPNWTLPSGLFHAVFPSRRGLVPAVRLFIDTLAHSFSAGFSRDEPPVVP